jgi:uncharacterized membrane protein YbhN (UPF0104 family)
VAGIVLRERDQAAQAWAVLQRANLSWLAAVLLIAAGIVAVHGVTYREVLRRLGHRLALPPIVGVHLQRVLVGTVSPIGGPPSLYVLVRRLDRYGVPAEDALLTATLRSVAGYGAFVALLAPALVIQPPSREVRWAAAVLAVGFVVAMAALLSALGGDPAGDRWASRLPVRLRGPLDRACRHDLRAGDLLRPFVCAFAVKIGGVALLYASLRAVGYEVVPTTALVAYVVGILFLLVAPVFQGVGVVEASMAVTLERLGVPPGTALGAVVLTRVAELWLPLSLALLVQAVSTLRPALWAPKHRQDRPAAHGPARVRPAPSRPHAAILPRIDLARPAAVPVRIRVQDGQGD